MSDHMWLYDSLRKTPQEARKPITGGRLNGFTDINPMWRIKKLTETFGPCGIGWYFDILDKKIVPGPEGEAAAFVDIKLYYRTGERWSEGIPGTGGAAFVAKEKNSLRMNDECYKMALTDALGSACKNMGMSADIYYEKDRDSKYERRGEDAPPQTVRCQRCGKDISGVQFKSGEKYTPDDILRISREKTNSELCWTCLKNHGESYAGKI